MRSWFHFLPIYLLLALSGPAAAIPTKLLVLGAEDNWYLYIAYKDGRIRGMGTDITWATFRAADTSVQPDPYPYSRCIKLILKGLIADCFSTLPNPHILIDYRLPRHPLFRAEIQLWMRRNEAQPVSAEQALSGRKIVVTLSYEYSGGFDRRRDLVRIPVCRDYYGSLMLQRDRVDYALACRNTARQLSSERPKLKGQFQPAITVYRPEPYLLFPRHHPQAEHLLGRFDFSVQRILASGGYQKILDGWSQTTNAIPQSSYIHRRSIPQGADMAFTPELVDGLELLALFNLNDIQERLKVHHITDGKAVAAARCLCDKEPIDQPDDGYLTSPGLDTAEQAQSLLTILKG